VSSNHAQPHQQALGRTTHPLLIPDCRPTHSVLIEGVYAVPTARRRSGRKPGQQPGDV
jgi:hypothetical protein